MKKLRKVELKSGNGHQDVYRQMGFPVDAWGEQRCFKMWKQLHGTYVCERMMCVLNIPYCLQSLLSKTPSESATRRSDGWKMLVTFLSSLRLARKTRRQTYLGLLRSDGALTVTQTAARTISMTATFPALALRMRHGSPRASAPVLCRKDHALTATGRRFATLRRHLAVSTRLLAQVTFPEFFLRR